MAKHNELGKTGEDKAADYLIQKGYTVLERNWRLNHLELDIVCTLNNLLVIVEVKTRTSPEERPEELLNYRKRRNLLRAADAYVKVKGVDMEVRFDLIVLTGDRWEVEHIVDAVQTFGI